MGKVSRRFATQELSNDKVDNMWNKETRRDWESKNRQHIRDYHNSFMKEFKEKIFSLLGNKCVVCDYQGLALQVDHVNGNGSQERKKYTNSYSFYNHVLKELLNGSKDYQLLCANCNWEKRYVNHEYN